MRLIHKAIYLIVALLVCCALCSPAAAERWRWTGSSVSGCADVRVFGPARMAAVDQIAQGLGYAAARDKNDLVVRASVGLRFVPGAAAVWIGYNVIALPSRTRDDDGHFWIDADSALMVFSQFLRRNGGAQTLRWAGKDDSNDVEPPQITQTAPKKAETPAPLPAAGAPGRLARVKNVRWGGEAGVVRAVLDLEGDGEVKYATVGNKTAVQTSALAAGAAENLSDTVDGVALSVRSGEPSRLDFSHPGRSAKIFVLKNPHRLVIDFLPAQGASAKIRTAAPKPRVQAAQSGGSKKNPSPAVRTQSTRRRLVVIDAGHGGKDPGAIAHGYQEKNIALQISTKLAARLRQLGVDVKMTRTKDTYPTLRERTEMANKWNASVFISVHLNALPKGQHSNGVEIYIMAEPTDKDALALAKIENAEIADGAGNSRAKSDRRTEMLLEILGNLQQNQKIVESTQLAEKLFLSGQKAGLDMKRVAQAPFWVLRGAVMPAVLIETGFITERAEARRLAQPAYQQRMANAIAAGVISFMKH